MSIQILGGGLAGTLIAYFLTKRGYSDFVLYERNKSLGGKHTWCFFDSDVDESLRNELNPLITHRWNSHEVHFPTYQRTFETGYNCVRSDDFHKFFIQNIPPQNVSLNSDIKIIKGDLKIGMGTLKKADIIFDARGVSPWEFKPCGFQKFFGLDLEFEIPHGLVAPVIMDATCEQTDGFRFFYLLPFDETTMLIEDTRYSDTAGFDDNEMKDLVLQYAAEKFGAVKQILREESASLAIPFTNNQFKKFHSETELLAVGLRGGWFNPVTGYSFPQAIRLAKLISENLEAGEESLRAVILGEQKTWQKSCKFYFMLNKMLFGAAKGADRRSIFQRFYSLPQSTIEHFYSGQLKRKDKFKLLFGRPPVAISKAAKSIVSSSWLDSYS